jgi:glyoxylase-like metal-dependent hydrolase (beta-lactamase superfamily II)
LQTRPLPVQYHTIKQQERRSLAHLKLSSYYSSTGKKNMENFEINQLTVGLLGTNCWIYPLEDEPHQLCILIDPGSQAYDIIACLNRLNLIPRYIVLTHGHFDHIAALSDIASHYGSGTEICIHSADKAYLGEGAFDMHRRSVTLAGGGLDLLDEIKWPLPEADRLLADGDTIGPLKTLHLPGHSPGSAGFYDEKRKVLFSGDTLFYENRGRTDLLGGSDHQLKTSLERLFTLDEDTAVFPGHGTVTNIGQEKANYQKGMFFLR